MDLTKVILRPLVTEKSYVLKEQKVAKYMFVVDKKATKTHIKQAFKVIFSISPEAVNTMLRKPRPTRMVSKNGSKYARDKRGYSKLQKIVYITLPAGISLDAVEPVESNPEKEKDTK